MRTFVFGCLVFTVAFVSEGCREQSGVLEANPEAAHYVSGTVESVEDAVPVDGGVTVRLQTVSGHPFDVYLESFFTATPPPASRWEVYEKLRSLQPGDRVLIGGEIKEERFFARTVSRL